MLVFDKPKGPVTVILGDVWIHVAPALHSEILNRSLTGSIIVNVAHLICVKLFREALAQHCCCFSHDQLRKQNIPFEIPANFVTPFKIKPKVFVPPPVLVHFSQALVTCLCRPLQMMIHVWSWSRSGSCCGTPYKRGIIHEAMFLVQQLLNLHFLTPSCETLAAFFRIICLIQKT